MSELMKRTVRSLLEDPLIAEITPEAIRGNDLSQESWYGWTLEEMAEKMNWRCLERGFSRLLEVASRGRYCWPLYTEAEIAADPARKGVSVTRFPSDDPAADSRPFILLIPGGGFVNVWNLTEGWPVAQHFNARGYHVFILTYQVGIAGSAVRAMEDAARALRLIASNREAFGVDPARYITCGFSAGGYLTCLWNTEKGYRAFGLAKPLACFPIYPVTSYKLLREENWEPDEDPDDFARAGVGCTIDEACSSCFEIPEHVEGFPPAAIFLAAEDDLVPPDHSRLLTAALEKARIPCRLEIGPTGSHGFADGTGMCMEGWPERAVDWFESL